MGGKGAKDSFLHQIIRVGRIFREMKRHPV